MNVVKNEMQERKKPDRRYNKCERNVLENQKQQKAWLKSKTWKENSLKAVGIEIF